MTTSIKSVTGTEANNRIHELFGDLSLDNIAIVRLNDIVGNDNGNINEEIQTYQKSSIKLTSVSEVRSNIEMKLKRDLTLNDVKVINLNEDLAKPPSFDISTTNVDAFMNKIKQLGFNLDSSNIAIITADSLGLSTHKNTTTTNKKLKK